MTETEQQECQEHAPPAETLQRLEFEAFAGDGRTRLQVRAEGEAAYLEHALAWVRPLAEDPLLAECQPVTRIMPVAPAELASPGWPAMSTTVRAVTPAAVREALARVRALLAVPERWTQGTGAIDAAGQRCDVTSHAACAWCLMGAVLKVAGLGSLGREVEAAVRAALPPGWRGPIAWNDSKARTHADVLRVLDAAIASLPESPAEGGES